MIFSSLFFIFIFLPLVLVAYYLVPRKFKNLCLVLFSLVFYAWGEPIYVLLMIFTILVDYACGLCVARFIDRRGKAKLFITINIVINLALLGFFKYAGMLVGTFDAVTGLGLSIPEVALPIGISFYTFESMSYAIDVYRREAPAMRNIIDFAAYLSFFPHLVAGPIVRYEALQAQVLNRRETLEKFTEGTKRFLTGLFKKVLIADNLAILAERVQYLGTPSTLTAWMGILAFTFQIYFDFSGYSDMAIGLGKMFGFELPENFDHPYVSQSVSEFWRRWHMTLGSWFREYLYIPLGGNRVSRPRLYFNLFVVWAATGFWHGASWNFIFWGLFFFVFLVIERMGFKDFLDRHRAFSHVYVIFFLLLSWALFAVTDLGMLGDLFTRMFVPAGGVDWIYYLRNYLVVFVLGIVLSTPVFKGLYQRLEKNNAFCLIFFGAIFLASTAYLVDATYNPFLYFRF